MFQLFTKSSEEPRIVFGCMSNIGPDSCFIVAHFDITYSFCIFSFLIFRPSSYKWLILILNAEASEISNSTTEFINAYSVRPFFFRSAEAQCCFLYAAREATSHRHLVIHMSLRFNDMIFILAGTSAKWLTNFLIAKTL